LVLPSDPRLVYWLQAKGSLTSRLRRHGLVEVLVQAQGVMPLWAPEQAELQQRAGYVREVVLLLEGRPAVWARSVTPLHAIKGPWRAMQGLGTRPLAELLFAARYVEREPLQAMRIPSRGLMQNHIDRQWLQLPQHPAQSGMPRWARSSVFRHDGHPLRVMEAFSPWLRALSP
jgi:chorismate--pyruvate lyase